ncbi:MAG TPA: response regulator transcription factor [Blastocatellia bacterium]|nr:response regulator transcription factor [Blastocatellia bacterium]
MGQLKSLLIVDDNLQVRRMIRALVEDLADRLFECADGEAALVAYREHRPDWVLMDVEMQGMDGLTATANLLADFPEARVVIVTRHSGPTIHAAAQAAGARAFLTKDNLLGLREIIGGNAGL